MSFRLCSRLIIGAPIGHSKFGRVAVSPRFLGITGPKTMAWPWLGPDTSPPACCVKPLLHCLRNPFTGTLFTLGSLSDVSEFDKPLGSVEGAFGSKRRLPSRLIVSTRQPCSYCPDCSPKAGLETGPPAGFRCRPYSSHKPAPLQPAPTRLNWSADFQVGLSRTEGNHVRYSPPRSPKAGLETGPPAGFR